MLAKSISGHRTSYSRIAILGLAVVTIAFLPEKSDAQQWQVTPSIGVGLQFDDNASLNTSSDLEASVDGYLAEAEVSFSYASPLTKFTLAPGALLRRYHKFSELNSDDLFVGLHYDYSRERSNFRTRAFYSDESARTAERAGVDFEIVDPNEIPEDDSGLVLGTEKRKRAQVTPQWSYQAGQKSTVSIGANFIDVTYEDQAAFLNSGYREMKGKLGFAHDWTERNTFTLESYYRENKFESLDANLSGYGATAGFRRALTENSLLIVKAGIDSTEDVAGNRQTNPVGEISLARTLERTKVLASYRRVVSGSGAGNISLRDSVALSLTHDLSQKVLVGAGVRAYRTEGLDADVANFDERDYLQFRALLSWNMTAVLSFEFDYSYTQLDRQNLPSEASSNLINLWLRYQPRR